MGVSFKRFFQSERNFNIANKTDSLGCHHHVQRSKPAPDSSPSASEIYARLSSFEIESKRYAKTNP